MTTVQVRCPTCHEMLHMEPSALQVTSLPRDGQHGRVALTCPQCQQRGSVLVEAESVRALRARGCPLAPELLARVRHPAGKGRTWQQPHDLPPLTWDDLLDFHALLERDDWFERLLEHQT